VTLPRAARGWETGGDNRGSRDLTFSRSLIAALISSAALGTGAADIDTRRAAA
jgi:hypothetical protein